MASNIVGAGDFGLHHKSHLTGLNRHLFGREPAQAQAAIGRMPAEVTTHQGTNTRNTYTGRQIQFQAQGAQSQIPIQGQRQRTVMSRGLISHKNQPGITAGHRAVGCIHVTVTNS